MNYNYIITIFGIVIGKYCLDNFKLPSTFAGIEIGIIIIEIAVIKILDNLYESVQNITDDDYHKLALTRKIKNAIALI